MTRLKTIIKRTEEGDLTHNLVMRRKADGSVTVIGQIENRYTNGDIYLGGVSWVTEYDFQEGETLELYHAPSIPNIINDVEIDYTINETGMVSEGVDSTEYIDIIQNIYTQDIKLLLVNEELFETYKTYIQVSVMVKQLIKTYPAYGRIMIDGDGRTKAVTILDLLEYVTDEQRQDLLLAMQYSSGNIQTLKALAERVLETADAPAVVHDLMTQEQQVEAFIEFSKVITEDQEEVVSDESIEEMKASKAYQTVLEKLDGHGFGLSKTQQFNVFQSAGLLSKENKLFNLSDMGSGKTLMTVETIFLLDVATINKFETKKNYNDYVKYSQGVSLPNKNLVTPKLSVISSWVKTFELFYDVEQVTDNHYVLNYTQNGVLYTSDMYVSPFTVKASTITIEEVLPKPEQSNEYLIVDEIHQLVQKPMTRTRIFSPEAVIEHYKTFILSGTLSNLTTHQWMNYVKLFDTQYNEYKLDNYSTKDMGTAASSMYTETKTTLRKSGRSLLEVQKRYFDPEALTAEQTEVDEKHLTAKEKYYHIKYSSKLLILTNPTESVEAAIEKDNYEIIIDPSVSDTPNFELFYNLVGDRAITAQSVQIAEELFGEQKTQHNAEVIKTPSMLTSDDIEIIKALHKITSEHDIYKSKHIATKLNNAILNLNDGLQVKNIYDLLTGFAENNSRFLEYLTGLDLKVLEKLPESSLIEMPELTETRKFKILESILENEPNETYLIVVNDYQSMKQLSEALGINHLSKKETTDALGYQDVIDSLFEKQNVVIVPQDMIKSSLDLVQANRLIQYQLNSEISDIIQTQNRINRIGQTRETKAFYIATDTLQENIIELFLETYKNIRVAHKGIVELFVDLSTQVNVVNDYIGKALRNVEASDIDGETVLSTIEVVEVENDSETYDTGDAKSAEVALDTPEVLEVETKGGSTDPDDEQASAALDTIEVLEVKNEGEGQLTLFDLSTIEEVEVEEREEDEVEEPFEIEGQLNLFSPDEFATDHQLIRA